MKKVNFSTLLSKKFVLLIMGFCMSFCASGQEGTLTYYMSVKSIQPQFALEYDTTYSHSVVTSNVPFPVNFKIKVSIKGDSVLLAQSNLPAAPSYTCVPTDSLKDLDPFDPGLGCMDDYYGFKGSTIGGVIPVHNYQVCITLVDATTYANLTAPQYYYYSIQTYSAPSLLFPGNADTLSNASYRIKFKWNRVTPKTKAATYYKLTVVPVLYGQTASYAMAHNTPILVADSLLDSFYSWHQRGDSIIEQTNYHFPVKTFAWQVCAYYVTGTSLGSSSIYSFIMGNNVPLVPQVGTFSDSIATVNANTLEIPSNLVAEYDTLQKVAFDSPPFGPWTAGENKTTLCDNGNWEDGTTDNWKPWLGYRNYLSGPDIVLDTPKWDAPGPHSRLDLIHATTPPTYDYWVGGNILPEVLKGGSYSMRLGPDNLQWEPDSFGNPDVFGVAQALDYDVALTDTPKVKFWYALVLQHGGHYGEKWSEYLNKLVIDYNSYYAESEFLVRITGYKNSLGIFIPFKKEIDIDSVYANIRDPAGLTQIVKGPGDTIDYKNWSCKTLNLPATAKDYLGNTITLANQTVTVEFITSGCLLGGHFGYAYIDGLCDNSDPTTCSFTLDTATCPNTDVQANGTASFGATGYYWSVQKCSANGDTLYGLEYNSHNWVTGQPGWMDINRMMNSFGPGLIPGNYYKVKLVIRNDCDDSVIATHEIHIRKLYANAGADRYICSDSSHTVTLGGTMINPAGTTYSWTSVPSGFSSSLANPTVTPSSTTTYIISVTDATCTGVKDTIHIYISPPITSMSVTPNGNICNGYTPYVDITPSTCVTDPSDITWKTTVGGTLIGSGYSLPNSTSYTNGYEDRAITVYFSDVCGDNWSLNFSLLPNVFYGYAPPLNAYPTSFSPPDYGGTAVTIFDDDLSYGETPAYAATGFILKIYNSEGRYLYEFFTNTLPNPSSGYWNGYLQWDGTDGYGHDYAPADYMLKPIFTSCNGNYFTANFQYTVTTPEYLFFGPPVTTVETSPSVVVNLNH